MVFAETVECGRAPVAAAFLADLPAADPVHLAQAAAVAGGAATALQVSVGPATLVPAHT